MSEISEQEALESLSKLRYAYDLSFEENSDDSAYRETLIKENETMLIRFAKQELDRREAERAEREKLLGDLVQIFDAADQERLKEVYERDAEAEKWKSEGDMYGWNFHKGMASGCTLASIIFLRVKRAIEKHLDLLLALRGVERENRK